MNTNSGDPNKTYLHQLIKEFKKTGKVGSGSDLNLLLDHYTSLEEGLDLEGERFFHAWVEVKDNRKRLEQMKEINRVIRNSK